MCIYGDTKGNRIVSAKKHYDLLIDEECDPYRDDGILKAYMGRWDGPQFFESLDLSIDKVVLEVGIGTGRVAREVLNIGCKKLTGLDISSKTIQRAKENLCRIYKNRVLY